MTIHTIKPHSIDVLSNVAKKKKKCSFKNRIHNQIVVKMCVYFNGYFFIANMYGKEYTYSFLNLLDQGIQGKHNRNDQNYGPCLFHQRLSLLLTLAVSGYSCVIHPRSVHFWPETVGGGKKGWEYLPRPTLWSPCWGYFQ